MTLIPYIDELGKTHYFDATRVMFTMSQVAKLDEEGKPEKILTKVAMDKNMGFIIADEPPAEITQRILDAVSA